MIVDRIDPCPSCGRVHGRISYSGPERRSRFDLEEEPVINVWRFIVLFAAAFVMWAAIIAAWIWAATK